MKTSVYLTSQFLNGCLIVFFQLATLLSITAVTSDLYHCGAASASGYRGSRQIETGFISTVGGSEYEEFSDVIPALGGGYWATGHTLSFGLDSSGIILARFSEEGVLESSRIFSTEAVSSFNQGNRFLPLADGGFYLFGTNNYFEIAVFKFDTQGLLEWVKQYNVNTNGIGIRIRGTSDGGFVVTGRTWTPTQIFVMKCNADGTVQWCQKITAANNDEGRDVIETSDGGFLITGRTSFYGAGDMDLFLAKFSSTGNFVWMKTVGGTGNDSGMNITMISAGSYLITGFCTSSYSGALYLICNDAGDISWMRRTNNPHTEYGYASVAVSGAEIVTIGTRVQEDPVLQITRFDLDGNIIWRRHVAGASLFLQSSFIETSDGGFCIPGHWEVAGSDYEAALIKLDSEGNIPGCSCISSETVSFVEPVLTTSSQSPTCQFDSVSIETPAVVVATPVMREIRWCGSNPDSSPEFLELTGGSLQDNFFAVTRTIDGGFLAAGTSSSWGVGGTDCYIVKFDSHGHVVWSRMAGGGSSDWVSRIMVAPQGGFYITGATQSYGAGHLDILISKYSDDGFIEWTRTIGGFTSDRGTAQVLGDGGLIVGGTTLSYGAGNYDFLVLRIDSSGSILWANTAGGSSEDTLNDIQPSNDGGFIACGYSYSYSAGTQDVFLVKFSYAGDYEWAARAGDSQLDSGLSVHPVYDGGFLVTGITLSAGEGDRDVFLMKFDPAGTLLWAKTYGGKDQDEGQ